jgi:hypothetical protein
MHVMIYKCTIVDSVPIPCATAGSVLKVVVVSAPHGGRSRTATQVHSQLVRELAQLPLDERMEDGRLPRPMVVLVRLLGKLDPSLSKRDQVRLFRS